MPVDISMVDTSDTATPSPSARALCAGPDILPHIIRLFDQSTLATAMRAHSSFFDHAGARLYESVTLDLREPLTKWPINHLLDHSGINNASTSKKLFLRRTRSLTLVLSSEDLYDGDSADTCAKMCNKVFESVSSLTINTPSVELCDNLKYMVAGKIKLLERLFPDKYQLQEVILATSNDSFSRAPPGFARRGFAELAAFFAHLTALRLIVDVEGGYDTRIFPALRALLTFTACASGIHSGLHPSTALAPIHFEFINGLPLQYIAKHLASEFMDLLHLTQASIHVTDYKQPLDTRIAAIFRDLVEARIDLWKADRGTGWEEVMRKRLEECTFTSRCSCESVPVSLLPVKLMAERQAQD